MKLLLLGGGVFLGAAFLDAALARGHAVTVFNRGRARQRWPAGVEVVTGDRSTGASAFEALRGRRFDAVVDTSGYVPIDVQASAAAFASSGVYLFVSSVSAYAAFDHAPVVEDDALAAFDAIAAADRDLAHYGPQKAACEAEVGRAFGARALIVRPGLIVGPGDPTGRFSHWPWRMAGGGEMLVPEVPVDAPLQFIDVRDLADWMALLLDRGTTGVFNATGPAQPPACTWPALLAACAAACRERRIAPAAAVPVAEPFLVEHGVAPWTELPLWLPSDDRDHLGFNRIDVGRAVATGLATRPLSQTVDAVLAEGIPPADHRRRSGKLGREREAAVLAAWRGG